MPAYNPTRDGNPFEWLLRAAAQVRAERVAERAIQIAAACSILKSAQRLGAASSSANQAESIGQGRPESSAVSTG